MDTHTFVSLFLSLSLTIHILKRRPLSCAVYYRPDTIAGHDTHRDCQPARTADIAADERWPFVRCLVMAVADCWMKPVQVGAGSWVLRASAARKAQLADQLPSQRSISLHESLREEHSLGGGFILEAFRGRRFGVAGAGEVSVCRAILRLTSPDREVAVPLTRLVNYLLLSSSSNRK